VDAFLRKLNLQQFNTPFDICAVLDYTDKVALNNTAAKAAIDMALHDLIGKLRDEPTWKLFGADPAKTPLTSFTIGMDEPAVIREKIKEAKGFPVLKIKLGGSDDLRILEAVKAASPDVFSVDANQGWTDREYALDMVHRLKEMNASFVEQPFLRTDFDSHAWLKERSPLPLIADESCQRLSDLAMCKDAFHGINIKLMKCTGLHEAQQMIEQAKGVNLRILIGCMSETSCAVSAAACLSPFAEWADLDGPLLIKNDVFDGVGLDNGIIALAERPGIGAVPKVELFE
jgi:L-alanine-DL-glutamate epimerase-like enolase superfamily enzyme